MASPNKQNPYYASHQSPHPQASTSPYAPRSPVIPSFNPQPYQISPQTHRSTEYSTTQYLPPIPSLPPSHSFPTYHPPPTVKLEHIDGANDDMSRSTRGKNIPSSSTSTPIKAEESRPRASSYRDPNPNNIEIRTKFPVARIKRIMQADEEVGKVAQVTPVAVSKALELFMIALVTGAAEKARLKGGKRVTAQHLKMVVEEDEQFDFLGDIVKRVADVQEGAGGEGRRKKKREDSSDSEEVEKKGKKGKGRRKKADD